jgi:beta-glucosidase
VVHEAGCRIDRALPTIDMNTVAAEGRGSGLTLHYFDNPALGGDPVSTETSHVGRLTWIGSIGPDLTVAASSVRIRATFTPDVGGRWRLGLESAGRSTLRLDGELVVDNTEPARGQSFYGAGSALVDREYALEAGRDYALEVDLWPRSAAVVVVGSNGSWESEGFDRPDLSLPGRQRQLVEAITAVNSRTVVVVNAGSPVELPWAEEAGAVLVAWYPGEEGADATADILVGLAEPSGRLPVSFPHRIEDTPAHGHYPGADGKVTYGEGVFVGYRHYETAGVAPHFPFGHGLSYTTFAYGKPTVAQADGRTALSLDVTNTGTRRGSEVVQVYVRAHEPSVARPERVLAAFAKVTLDAGATSSVALALDDHAFSYWDVDSHGWVADGGAYTLLIGASSRDIHHTVEVSQP